jgi:hypothetical protein
MRSRIAVILLIFCLGATLAFSEEMDRAGGGQGKIATLLPALVWNPHSLPSGDSLYQTMLRGDYEATLTTDLSPFIDSLSNYHLFIMAGIEEYSDSILALAEIEPFLPAILSLLESGGSAYWEGAYAFPGGSSLYNYFNAFPEGLETYIRYLRGNDNSDIFSDIDSLVYNSAPITATITCTCGSYAYIFSRDGGGGKGVICQVEQTHTMLTNFSWARLNDSGTNTRVDLINDVMDWLSGTTAVEEPIALPSELSLSQNYPNPFNATTTINYALPVAGNVRLQVYDIMGRAVATLENGIVPAGYHKGTWNAQGMPSGLYFVRLSTNQFSETRKMMLLK